MVFPVLPDWPPEVGPVTAEFPRCNIFPPHVDAAVSQHAWVTDQLLGNKRPVAQMSLIHTYTHTHTPLQTHAISICPEAMDAAVIWVCRLVVQSTYNHSNVFSQQDTQENDEGRLTLMAKQSLQRRSNYKGVRAKVSSEKNQEWPSPTTALCVLKIILNNTKLYV